MPLHRRTMALIAMFSLAVFAVTTTQILAVLEEATNPSRPRVSKHHLIEERHQHDQNATETTSSRAPFAERPNSFQEYLANCHGDDIEAITLTGWMGRSGNHIEQLMVAFAFAMAAGRPFVVTPPWNDSVFNVPDRLPVQTPLPSNSLQPTGSCKFRGNTHDCSSVFHQRCATTVSDRREIYLRQIAPLVRPEVYNTCVPSSKDTLVIHVRDGDAAHDVASSHTQPPCEYFHRIIEIGNRGHAFSRLILVHSGQDPENLCVEAIRSRHSGKLVDLDLPTSIAHDACVILQASNLALTSSAFGVSFAMMNTRVDQLFVIDAVTSILDPRQPKLHADAWNVFTLSRKIDDFQLDAKELCAAFPRAMHYRVPSNGTIISVTNEAKRARPADLSKRRNGLHQAVEVKENKLEYFLHYSKYAKLVETNCSALSASSRGLHKDTDGRSLFLNEERGKEPN
jgi:hypothetical protein